MSLARRAIGQRLPGVAVGLDPMKQARHLSWSLHRLAPVGQNEKGDIMEGFVQDIEGLAIQNGEFRRVLYTAKHCQLVDAEADNGHFDGKTTE